MNQPVLERTVSGSSGRLIHSDVPTPSRAAASRVGDETHNWRGSTAKMFPLPVLSSATYPVLCPRAPLATTRSLRLKLLVTRVGLDGGLRARLRPQGAILRAAPAVAMLTFHASLRSVERLVTTSYTCTV
eukprot:scaffold674_cov371-Prasinococcus_capsulatus_cf.AAC.11